MAVAPGSLSKKVQAALYGTCWQPIHHFLPRLLPCCQVMFNARGKKFDTVRHGGAGKAGEAAAALFMLPTMAWATVQQEGLPIWCAYPPTPATSSIPSGAGPATFNPNPAPHTLAVQVMAAIGSNSERWGFFTVDLEFERRAGGGESSSSSSEGSSAS